MHIALRMTRVESMIIVKWSLEAVDTVGEIDTVEPSLRLLVFGGKSIYVIPLLLEYSEGSG